MWWVGVTHGVSWKLTSLASKAGFLLVIAPGLATGQFAAYLFYSTVALVLGRFGACGLSDQLVLEIRGREEFVHRYRPLYSGLFLGALGVFFAGVVSGSALLRVVALGCALIASGVLEGVLRALWPSRYEQLANGPPVLFLVFVTLVPSRSAVNLLALYCASILLFQGWVGWRSGFWSGRGRSERIAVAELATTCKRGFAKMIAEMTLLLNMRGLILWPKLVAGGLASDSLSLALAIGEAVSTLPMVVVNRNFSSYASAKASWRYAFRTALMIVVLMLIPALVLLMAWDLTPHRMASKVSAIDLASALLLFGVVTAYLDLRYRAWASLRGTRGFTVAQLAFFATQGLIVSLLGPKAVLPAVALLAAAIVCLWSTLEFRYQKSSSGGKLV